MRGAHSLVLAARCGLGVGLVTLRAACAPVTAQLVTRDSPRTIPQPSQTAPTPASSATRNPSFLRDPEAAPWGVTLVPHEALVGHYTNYIYPVQIPRDGGPIKYAEGTPITEGSEVMAYTVAPGDIYDYIAKRFHLTNDGYLLILNEQRRGEAAPLYAGDVLNLSAYTLRKYGTVNGHVADGPRPLTAPHQER